MLLVVKLGVTITILTVFDALDLSLALLFSLAYGEVCQRLDLLAARTLLCFVHHREVTQMPM